ncbi:MAG: hypothetical protein QXT68_04350 [Halobacteria archaeon]
MESSREMFPGWSYARVRKFLSSLAAKGWARRVERGAYALTPPEEVVRAIAFSGPASHPFEVVGRFGDGRPYKFAGSTALGFYTAFMRDAGNVCEIKVPRGDQQAWMMEFRKRGVEASRTFPARGARYVAVVRTAPAEDVGRRVRVEGYWLEPPEEAVVEGLNRGRDQEAAMALMARRKDIDYPRLAEEARKAGLARSLGFLMEVLNREAREELFPERAMAPFRKSPADPAPFEFSAMRQVVDKGDPYADIRKSWGVAAQIDPDEAARLVMEAR